MNGWMFTAQDLQTEANKRKAALIERLEKDGYLKPEDNLNQRYIFLTVEKGWFGRIFDKMFGAGDDNQTAIHLVKLDSSNFESTSENICDLCCEQKLRDAEKELSILRNFVRNIRDNFDCDKDAHRYSTFCRCCEAEKLLPKGRK